MDWATTFAKLLDPYDLRARLFPGLLLLLPAIAFLVLIYGRKNPALVALSSVLAACGGPYLLASFVRTWGQRAQVTLYRTWGAQPASILLRHRDSRLPSQTKLRYHTLAQQKLGVAMPTNADEAKDPNGADQAYAAAADALRPRTADQKKFPFVFKELVAYGFNRNAYGSRWVGVAICVATLIATLLHAGALTVANPPLDLATLKSLDIAHALTLVIAFVLILIWLLHFTSRTVEQAGFSYALRLWETLEKITKK
jgi:hypothetical protein